MQDQIYLSKERINELKKELKVIEKSMYDDQEYQKQRGGAMDSFHETASFQATSQATESKYYELKKILENAQVLDKSIKSDKIRLGSYVDLKDENNQKLSYRLVHPIEADISKNKLSVESPLGSVLLGKTRNEKCKVNEKEYIIEKIY